MTLAEGLPLPRRLEELWERGERPDIYRFVAEAGMYGVDELAAALGIDQWQRWNVGERIPVEEYLDRYPKVATDPELAMELVYGEFLIREQLGEKPTAEEYLGRFPGCAALLQQQFALHRELEPNTFQCDTHVDDGLESSSQQTFAPLLSKGAAAPWPVVAGYEILAELGRGGMGVVYKARHKGLGRLVALKLMRWGLDCSAGERARFRREAEAVARLQHPHVVQIYEVGEQDGRPFLSLEFLEGGSLAGQLDGTPRPGRAAAELVETLARAVHAAHQLHIIHRDLKPDNVLLTAGGVPKVADFGLAKLLDNDQLRTGSDAVLGTPCYMAPEQAQGKSRDLGPAADVYALGAVLYELVTGRPPFRAETALDTILQVVQDEPVPPARLNPRLAGDLETICLKCLQKEPSRRYASAQDLAEDLRRFRAGEPIHARPVGRLEKAAKWVRRRPAAAAFWTMGLVSVLLALGGWWWLERQAVEQRAEEERRQAAARQEAEAALARAADLQKRARWKEAQAFLDLAADHLGSAGPADLRQRVEAARADLHLADRLETARLLAALTARGRFDFQLEERGYLEAFRETGLARPGDDVSLVADRVRASGVRKQLVAALDEWAARTPSRLRQNWLLAVGRRADPGSWRDRFRNPAVWEQPARLKRLARTAPLDKLSLHLVNALAEVMMRHGLDVGKLLRAAQQRHPEDFWLNFNLAVALQKSRPQEAAGFYRVALALRPNASVIYNNLGNVLADAGLLEEAIGCLRKALAQTPNEARVINNLATALDARGLSEEAIALYQRALALNPRYVEAHYNLGLALFNRGDVKRAIAHYQQALAVNPNLARVYCNLGIALYTRNNLDGALVQFDKALSLDPQIALAHHNRGNVLRVRGQLPEAIAEYRRAIALGFKDAKVHAALGLALALRKDLDGAMEEYYQAIALDPTLAAVYTNLGSALQAKGNLEGAIAKFRQAVAPRSRGFRGALPTGHCPSGPGRPRRSDPRLWQGDHSEPTKRSGPLQPGYCSHGARPA
jgi:serine/threonine-protein kinase